MRVRAKISEQLLAPDIPHVLGALFAILVVMSGNTSEKAPVLEAQPRPNKRRTYALIVAYILGSLVYLYHYPTIAFTAREDYCGTSVWKIPGFEYRCTSEGVDVAQLSALAKSFDADPSLAEQLFIENPSTELLSESLKEYTKHPHLAGNLALARYTRDKWLAAGIEDVEIVSYDVLLNYPTNRSQVSLFEKNQKVWSATLKEDVIAEDPGSREAVPFFHGYSKNGSATGALIYVNFGRPQDFEAVSKLVNLKGKIAIARYGHLFRGLKVELAQKYGMKAILLYDDPSEDYGITVENGYAAYPDGPARNPSAVQRGSVQFLSVLPGDPTTPGYPSTPGCKRQDPYKSIPGIPSIPISGRDALFLLKSLNGNGPVVAGFKGAFPDVLYNIGGTYSELIVSLDNIVDYDYRPIYNVIAKIPGHFDDTIILGNHRDAWVRGAADPNSGSAALDSIIGTFGALQRTGYQPLRSLIFASWDGEEYGLLGSTEWVEEHAKELSANTIAYLNVDVASSGVDFKASASPFLFDILRNATKQVPAASGESGVPGTDPEHSLREEWSGHISTLGSGSDYTAFQDALGITSIDMGFAAGPSSKSVYHYHSQYDSFHWLTQYGDPGLKALQAATRLWGLLAYKLSESPVIAFNATTYGIELSAYITSLSQSDAFDKHRHHGKHDLKELEQVAKKIQKYARDLDARAAITNAHVAHWSELNPHEQTALLKSVEALNEEYKHVERAFLDKKGLKGRSFFKHVLYAPGRWTGYAGAVFPSIVEAETRRDYLDAIHRVVKILKRVGQA